MRTRPPRWTDRRAGSGHTLFGGTGWLFADLMVALAMVFLVATTVGFPPIPHVQPPPKHSTHTRKSPVPQSSPVLDLHYIDIQFTIDPADLVNNGSTARSQIQAAISGNSELASHCTGQLSSGCVGLVLLFGGVPTPDPADYHYGKQLDDAVMKVLTGGLGSESSLFQVALSRDFYNNGAMTSQFEVNLYVFSTP
jgi:hypothetical protein